MRVEFWLGELRHESDYHSSRYLGSVDCDCAPRIRESVRLRLQGDLEYGSTYTVTDIRNDLTLNGMHRQTVTCSVEPKLIGSIRNDGNTV